MLISFVTLIILSLSAFFTSILAGTIGMGGGVIFVGILASFIDIAYVVPLHAALMGISNASRIILFFNFQIRDDCNCGTNDCITNFQIILDGFRWF